MEIERVRIVDFYFNFPHLIAEINMPADLIRRKGEFKTAENPYQYHGNAKFLLAQLKIFQQTAINLLAAKEIIDAKALEKGIIKKGNADIPSALKKVVLSATEKNQNLLHFLINDLSVVPLLGNNGLKKRTGLLEYRYDDA